MENGEWRVMTRGDQGRTEEHISEVKELQQVIAEIQEN
jgi:hypothetical protein